MQEIALLLGFQAYVTFTAGFILTTQRLPNSTTSEETESAEPFDTSTSNPNKTESTHHSTDPSFAPALACMEPTVTELEVRLQLLHSELSREQAAEPSGLLWNVTGYLTGLGYRPYSNVPECSRRPSDLAEHFPIVSLEGKVSCPWQMEVNTNIKR